MKILKRILLFFFLLIVFFNNTYSFSIEDLKKRGYNDIKIDIRIEDENKKELILPINVTWKNYNKKKTYKSVNFLEDSLVSLERKVPKKENYGYLYFSNSKTKNGKKVFKKSFSYKINYDYKGRGNTKRELYFLQLERKGNFYIVKNFYSQSDLIKKEKEKVKKAIVFIKGDLTNKYISDGATVGIYNSKGENLYFTYVKEDGTFSFELVNFKNKWKLDKDYYLIWGKFGNVEEGSSGILFESRKYNFKSYMDLINTFKKDLKLEVEINKKDKPVIENPPYILILILLLIYSYFSFVFYKKGIKKLRLHPDKIKNEVINEKRKQKILNIKKRYS